MPECRCVGHSMRQSNTEMTVGREEGASTAFVQHFSHVGHLAGP